MQETMLSAFTAHVAKLSDKPANISAKTPGNWRFLLQAHHAKCVEFATFHAQTRASLGLAPRGHKGNWLPKNSRRIDRIHIADPAPEPETSA